MPKGTTEAAAPKKERKVLTHAERIAKLEAELAAARAKAEEKEAKAKRDAVEQVNKLIAKRDELNAKIDALIAEHGLETGTPAEVVAEVTPTEDTEAA